MLEGKGAQAALDANHKCVLVQALTTAALRAVESFPTLRNTASNGQQFIQGDAKKRDYINILIFYI